MKAVARGRSAAGPAAPRLGWSGGGFPSGLLPRVRAVETVLAVGAGASVAEAMGRHAKWEKDRPPLDLDFFTRAKAAAREPSLIRRISEHATSLGHPDPSTSTTPTSLEHYLGLLYFRLLHEPTPEDKSAYFDLPRLYNRELLSTTNWLVGRPRGQLEMLIRRELSRETERLTVVTFDHDLLIENALATLPGRAFGKRFCLRHSYGFDESVRTASVSGVEEWEPCAGDHGEVVAICKLHGSLNWVFTTRDLTLSLNLARAKKAIHLLRPKRPRADLRIASSRRRYYLWPVVVPPIYEKQGFITTHLQAVWDRATDALRQADRIVFVGYSFPAADHHARFFFEGLANANPSLKRPAVIPGLSCRANCVGSYGRRGCVLLPFAR
jgi:hypothetical protein